MRAGHYNNLPLALDIKPKFENYSELTVFHGFTTSNKPYPPIPEIKNLKPKKDKPLANSDCKKYRKPFNNPTIKSSNSGSKDSMADLSAVWTG
jgi:hypothetical protein